LSASDEEIDTAIKEPL
jgi:hypothetical protein